MGRTIRQWLGRSSGETLGLVFMLAACAGRAAPSASSVTLSPDAASTGLASAAPLPAPPPAPVPPDPARCGGPIDPPPERWPELEGCRVTFKAATVEPWIECTRMACGPELPCCNRCYEGALGLRIDRREVALTRGGQLLRCGDGRSCEIAKVCALPPGPAVVSGVLSHESEETAKAEGRSSSIWSLELERFEPR